MGNTAILENSNEVKPVVQQNAFALPGETLIGKFFIRSDQPGYETKEKAEKRMASLFSPKYDTIRFSYENIVHLGEVYSSDEFARLIGVKHGRGGAVYGVPKT